MKKQGKVKSISLTEEQVIENMQVMQGSVLGKVTNIHSDKKTVTLSDLSHTLGGYPCKISQLKKLVIEYENEKQLPLKYSQWQSAIDNGEVDSDKAVEFEIDVLVMDILRPNKVFAKIIP